jgi:hypothetical protein
MSGTRSRSGSRSPSFSSKYVVYSPLPPGYFGEFDKLGAKEKEIAFAAIEKGRREGENYRGQIKAARNAVKTRKNMKVARSIPARRAALPEYYRKEYNALLAKADRLLEKRLMHPVQRDYFSENAMNHIERLVDAVPRGGRRTRRASAIKTRRSK